jgi:hypothetical protein
MSSVSFKPAKHLPGVAIWLALGCSSPRPAWVSVWKCEQPYSRPIPDPFAWAATQFLDSPNAPVDAARLESFEADIDHDGIGELFITSATTTGNAGGSYLGFRKEGRAFFYIGQIGLRRDVFRVLPLGEDHRPRLLVYQRLNAAEGTLAVFTNDGRKFWILRSETIRGDDSGTDEGRRRLAEAFGLNGI